MGPCVSTVLDKFFSSRRPTLTPENFEFFRTVFYSLNDPVFIHDSSTCAIIDFNAAACGLYGYSPDELGSLTVEQLSAPDEKYNQRRVCLLLEKARSEGPHSFEWLARRKSGELFWVEVNARFISTAGFDFFLVTVHDISERKKNEEILRENEERLRTLINTMQDIVCFKDGQGRWLEANEFDLKLFQLEGVDYRGKKDSELARYSEFYREAFMTCEATDEKAWQVGSPTRSDEIIPLPDGTERVFDVIKIPTFTPEGRRKGLIVVGRDVTERKKAEKVLLAAKEEAERLNRLKTQFLSNMSHELRTPLNGIIGFLSLLGESYLDEKQKEYCSIASKSARHLLQMVSDILDIAKIESGHMELVNERVDIFWFMNALMTQFKRAAAEKGVSFVFEFDSAICCPVLCDELRLNQILGNLLSNAVKFTEKGSVKFGVEKLNETAGEMVLKFYVCDTGIGISQDRIGDLFQVFGQLDISNTKKFQGAGLGLSIVKKLLGLMGGKIEVKSVPGEGTTFTVELALQKDMPVSKPCVQNRLEERTARIKARGPLKALVVEDNYTNAYLCQLLLAKLGVSSDIVQDGRRAVAKFVEGKYDFVVMDIQLPELNGFEAAREIKKICEEKGNATPVIALTAYAHKSDRKRCEDAAMAAYVAKPFTLETLAEAVEKAVCG